MCEGKTGIGIVGRAECRRAQAKHDQKIREDAIRSVLGHQPAQSRLTPTEVAQRFLIGVGAVVLLASADFLAHLLLIVLTAVFGLVSITATTVIVRRRRQRKAIIPAPLPAAPPRTVVTGVTVRPIESPRRAAVAAGERDRSTARR